MDKLHVIDYYYIPLNNLYRVEWGKNIIWISFSKALTIMIVCCDMA